MDSLLESIQKIALLGVIKPDEEANLRKIFRWYSKAFHTPLSEVEDLPLEYVLIHYFEEIYDELDEEKLQEQVRLILETPEERQKREAEEDANEDAFIKELEEEALAESKGKLQKPALKTYKSKSSDIAVNPEFLGDSSELKSVIEESEIKISFVDEDLGESDFMPTKSRK